MSESLKDTAGQRPPPLDKVRVLDLSRVLAGPFTGMMLSDLGADVLKVESHDGGDHTRHWGTAIQGGERTYYLSINRNKRSMAVNFAKPEGAEIVRALARDSDVLLENYLLGALAKYGLDYESLRKENPKLIYCSISGYGRTGPDAWRPGYDSVIQAESGIMSVTGEPDGRPMKVGVPVSDVAAGMYATQAILAALFERSRTGLGQALDIALLDCTLANHVSVAANALLLGKPPRRFGNSHADIMPQGLYPAKNGDIMFHVGSDPQFRKFSVDVLELPELAEDPLYKTNEARGRNRLALDEIIIARLATKSREEWIPIFWKAGVPAGLVQNVSEALNSPHALARGMVTEIDHPTAGMIKLVGSPVKMSASPTVPPRAPPLYGEHTDEVLKDRLGYDDSKIAALRAAGAIV